MSHVHKKPEAHFVSRAGWLRAAVLGANDGIISVASLITGMAASQATANTILLTGIAALVAGALSMAAGEYVSVSSQADTEKADLEREQQELVDSPEAEKTELTQIYIGRGLSPDLAAQVAEQLTASNALEAHARDELGLSEQTQARPLQAAFASALTFSFGAAFPMIAMLLSPRSIIVWAVVACAALSLGLLGALGAVVGGARIAPAVLRVTFWGAVAMLVTAGIGHLFGTTVA